MPQARQRYRSLRIEEQTATMLELALYLAAAQNDADGYTASTVRSRRQAAIERLAANYVVAHPLLSTVPDTLLSSDFRCQVCGHSDSSGSGVRVVGTAVLCWGCG